MRKKSIILSVAALMLITSGCSSSEANSQASDEAVTTTSEVSLSSITDTTTEKLTLTTIARPETTFTKKITEKVTTNKQKTTTTARHTTKATAKVTTKPTTKVTTKPTTKATTKLTTKPTTKATTKLTTKATTKATTKTTTTAKATGSKPTSVVTQNDIDKIREGLLKLVNQERNRCGAGPLKKHKLLSSYAQTRSKEIITNFSHTRPNGKYYNTIIDRNAYPYSLTAEIIQNTSHIGNRSYTQEDLFVGKESQIIEAYTRIFNNFKNSEKHYKLMTDPRFSDTGIGISYIINKKGMAIFYVVQHLGDPKN